MKIRDKRCAYVYINYKGEIQNNLRFAYIDELQGDLMFLPFLPEMGKLINQGDVLKVDSNRPFALFNGDSYGSAPTLELTSKRGATYSQFNNSGDSGDGSAGAIVPGIQNGDFVVINIS